MAVEYARLMTTDIDFIHIGKTGGTALKDVFRRQLERTGVMPVRLLANYQNIPFSRMHDHNITFPRMCAEFPNLRALFFVRDPVLRYVSGFNGRLRQGRPRYHLPWSRQEAVAFRQFATPNDLAEALSEDLPTRRDAALRAMEGIRHVREHLAHYLGGTASLSANRTRIFYIGDLATFERDVKLLKRLLRIERTLCLLSMTWLRIDLPLRWIDLFSNSPSATCGIGLDRIMKFTAGANRSERSFFYLLAS